MIAHFTGILIQKDHVHFISFLVYFIFILCLLDLFGETKVLEHHALGRFTFPGSK